MTPGIAYFVLAFVICISLSLFGMLLIDHSRRLRRARLVRYSSDHPRNTKDRVARSLEIAPAIAKSGLRHDKSGISGLLKTRLREAGLALSVRTSAAVILLIAVFVAATLWLTGLLAIPLAMLVGAGCGWCAFSGYLGLLRARRVRSFNEALPDCLDILARGLRSGQPIAGALRVVAQHTKGIAQEEFTRCCDEMELGVPLIAALTGVAERIGTLEAHFVTVATSLQAETGGNLVETLNNLATLLRDKQNLRKKAAALSAEIRVSGVILSSLPFVIGAALFVMNPRYLNPLIADSRGQTMMAVGLVSLGLGIFSMYKLSRFDV